MLSAAWNVIQKLRATANVTDDRSTSSEGGGSAESEGLSFSAVADAERLAASISAERELSSAAASATTGSPKRYAQAAARKRDCNCVGRRK